MGRAVLSIVFAVGLVTSACAAAAPRATNREFGATPSPAAPSIHLPLDTAPSLVLRRPVELTRANSASILGSIPVNATMDSEDRFYATLFAAYGVALLWCIKNIERKSMVVYFLALTFFVGGLARLVSVAAVGLPNTFFVAMTVLELLIPFFMAFMQSRISKNTDAPTAGLSPDNPPG